MLISNDISSCSFNFIFDHGRILIFSSPNWKQNKDVSAIYKMPSDFSSSGTNSIMDGDRSCWKCCYGYRLRFRVAFHGNV